VKMSQAEYQIPDMPIEDLEKMRSALELQINAKRKAQSGTPGRGDDAEPDGTGSRLLYP
jgi:hypothetical protein